MGIVLSDDDMRKAFTDAGLPRSYHAKDLTLKSVKADGEAMGKALSQRSNFHGKWIEIASEDLFYLTVRAMVVKQIPVMVVYAEHLMNGSRSEAIDTMLAQGGVLAIEGLTPEGGDPFGKGRFSLEWMLGRWLKDNNSFLALTDTPLANFDELWSRRFRELLAARKLSI
tara:strand:- start:302 stop:808 length:507 start_codon:yes stop_codon:yes gene_type:complete